MHARAHTTHTHAEREREREREGGRERVNQTRIEQFRKFGVERCGLSADLNVSVVVAFPTWTGSEFQTDGPEGGSA